jgi:hypothetical protein
MKLSSNSSALKKKKNLKGKHNAGKPKILTSGRRASQRYHMQLSGKGDRIWIWLLVV